MPGPHDRIGVYAKTRFDVGTWIGPYEGKRLSLQDGAHFHADGRNRWEVRYKARIESFSISPVCACVCRFSPPQIYDGSTVIGFIDSDDERSANWMRYVQTARYEREQNLEVVQRANGDIFYRATKPIEAGTELLVWYGSGYHCHFDLPYGLNSEQGQGRRRHSIALGRRAIRLDSPAFSFCVYTRMWLAGAPSRSLACSLARPFVTRDDVHCN